MNKKLINALSTARVMPTTRPQVRPAMTAKPAKAMTSPTMISMMSTQGIEPSRMSEVLIEAGATERR